jgi:hypothetical protein
MTAQFLCLLKTWRDIRQFQLGKILSACMDVYRHVERITTPLFIDEFLFFYALHTTHAAKGLLGRHRQARQRDFNGCASFRSQPPTGCLCE